MSALSSVIRVAVLGSAIAGTAVLGGLAAPASASTCESWVGDQPQRVGTYTALYGVAVVSPCSAWAVGESSVGTVVEQWTGAGWIVIASPNPPGMSGGGFRGVAATSRSNAWAVGISAKAGVDDTLIERWTGTSWSIQASKLPSQTSNDLEAVAAVSSSDAWAVGSYSQGGHAHTLTERWDGHAWKVVGSPHPGGPAGDDSLTGVVAISATNAWAVGRYDTGSASGTLILHWNGTVWRVEKSAAPGTAGFLTAVTATSATNAWAVGLRTDPSTGQQRTLVEHWNGSAWKFQKSHDTPDRYNRLLGVTALSPTNAWAVGAHQAASGGNLTLIEHWDGAAWSIVHSPEPGGTGREHDLYGVSARTGAGVWAVGAYDNGATTQPLATHCC